MNAQQEAVALWQYLESRGMKPTHRLVASVLRSQGIKLRDGDLVAWLAPFRAVSRQRAGNKNPARGQQPGNTRETASREKEVSLVSKPPTSVVTHLPVSPKSARELKLFEPPRTARPPATAWVDTLIADVRRVLDRPLVALSPDDLFELARYHAFKFGNCTRDERTNRSRARGVAKSLAQLATHPEHGELTARDYLALAHDVWVAGGKTAWFRPWDVVGRITYDTA